VDLRVQHQGSVSGLVVSGRRSASAGVQARCQAQGMMGVCGFTEIQGCRCIQGQCRSNPAPADALRRPLTTNPETDP
jgi:hypothetical protein